jgi:protein TonB
LVVGVDGRVKACEIIGSSGSRSLDRKTCEIMSERARFTPAMDAQGKPIESTFTPPPIAWRLKV